MGVTWRSMCRRVYDYMCRCVHPSFALRIMALLLMACTTVRVWADPSAKDDRRKQSSRQIVKTIFTDDDSDLTQPDPMPKALSPQVPLSQDTGTEHQSLHFRGASTRRGIDVSHYQGRIDWTQVARSGEVSYVYVKATEGANLVDNTYRMNLTSARAAGIKVGIYHFFSPTAPIEQQFKNMTSNVNLSEIDLIPIIDVEHRGKTTHAEFCSRLSRFLRMVERHYNVQPLIYTGQNFYNKYLSGSFSNYRYMIAKYDNEIPYLIDDAPMLMWQFSATGHVPGIRGNVDRSCFMDNYDLNDILLR